MLRRRLHLQIYLTVIGSLVLVVVLTGILWAAFGREGPDRAALNLAGRLAYSSLPDAEDPPPQQRAALIELGRELDISITLFGPDRRLIATTGRMGPVPPDDQPQRGWNRVPRSHAWALGLPDGRWLVINPGHHGGGPFVNLALLLTAIAVGVGLGAYPLVRRLTRRLERLQAGVERIGAGDLSARVEVQGKDEVASLAASFNEAAEKIESLVSAHRMLLANASHELRTPLARIRLGAEMLKEGTDSEARREALTRDIAELDSLIDEILLMSRLDANSQVDLNHDVDFLALAAEECARFEQCTLTGWAPSVRGDPMLLRRMLRNLIENGIRHGAPPVTVRLAKKGDLVEMIVSDCGEGIPEAARADVFQPFYRAPGRQNVTGYGLGLPLVAQIAALHGGKSEILSTVESRSEIRITLPLTGKEVPPGPG